MSRMLSESSPEKQSRRNGNAFQLFKLNKTTCRQAHVSWTRGFPAGLGPQILVNRWFCLSIMKQENIYLALEKSVLCECILKVLWGEYQNKTKFEKESENFIYKQIIILVLQGSDFVYKINKVKSSLVRNMLNSFPRCVTILRMNNL